MTPPTSVAKKTCTLYTVSTCVYSLLPKYNLFKEHTGPYMSKKRVSSTLDLIFVLIHYLSCKKLI